MNQTPTKWILKCGNPHNLGLENHLLSFGERDKEREYRQERRKKGSKEKEEKSLRNQREEGD